MNTSGMVPPHDLDAEGAILSAVLNEGSVFDVVADQVSAEDFYSAANGAIFAAMSELSRRGVTIQLVSVSAYLRDRGLFASVGGQEYLVTLRDCIPTTIRIDDTAQVVADKARRRRMIATCQRIAAEGYSDVGDELEWIANCEKTVFDIAQGNVRDRNTVHIGQSISQVFSALSKGEKRPGIMSGLRDLDAMMGGFKPGSVTIIGAHSSVGKSALAMNLAVNAASETDSVLVFSLEMTHDELSTRALFAESRVSSRKVNHKDSITVNEWNDIAEQARRLCQKNIWIDDRPELTPLALRGKVRRIQAKAQATGQLALVVVDYLQLINGRTNLSKNASREQEVSEISRALKVMAKESNVPVVALAQLNADADKRTGDKKPRLSDLRESKAIAQNADNVILIHNPHALQRVQAYRHGHEIDTPLGKEKVDLIVAKHRGGMVGTVLVDFWPQYTLFADSTGD